ncbi:hypothetical protein, partial [Streptococcus pneumoniae]|uniref:hypothetical protein n=1 Tax=Streptococcus pneumoniae TaxID=1313 RepID=UPI001E2D4F26
CWPVLGTPQQTNPASSVDGGVTIIVSAVVAPVIVMASSDVVLAAMLPKLSVAVTRWCFFTGVPP